MYMYLTSTCISICAFKCTSTIQSTCISTSVCTSTCASTCALYRTVHVHLHVFPNLHVHLNVNLHVHLHIRLFCNFISLLANHKTTTRKNYCGTQVVKLLSGWVGRWGNLWENVRTSQSWTEAENYWLQTPKKWRQYFIVWMWPDEN